VIEREEEEFTMFKPERIISFAAFLVAAVVVETLCMMASGISNGHIFWTVFVQTLFAVFLVALADPTYRRGYTFAFIVSFAAFVFFLDAKPIMILEGLLFAASCIAMTWATYEVRRQWNWHQSFRRYYS
jgi:hypothetical protein